MAVDPDVDAAARQARREALEARVRYYAPNGFARAAHEQMRAAVLRPVSPELDEDLLVLTDVVLSGFNAAIARHHDALPDPPPPF